MKKVLGKITEAKLSMDRSTFLSFSILFEYDKGGGQRFCGIVLDKYDKEKKKRAGTAAGCDLIRQILTLFKVNDFREIEGRIAYAIKEEDFNSKIEGIEVPTFDGGGRFTISEWKEEWKL